MRRRTAAAALAAALVLTGTAACSNSGSGGSSGSSSASSIQGLTVSGSFGKQPTVKVHDLKQGSAKSATLIHGNGQQVTDNSTAKMQVLMAKGTDGTTIQSSYSSGQPQSIDLSSAPAWVQDALSGAHVGDRVAYVTPISKVNNGQGAPQLKLKASDDLVVVIDVLGVAPAPLTGPKGTSVPPPSNAPQIVEKAGAVSALDYSKAPKKSPSKFAAIPLVKGTGQTVKEGDTITVNYFADVWGQGTKPFNDTYAQGQPAQFQLQKGGLIEGWLKGLVGTKVGSRVMLIIPPSLGYGKQGNPQIKVGPHDTMVFVVDVLGVG